MEPFQGVVSGTTRYAVIFQIIAQGTQQLHGLSPFGSQSQGTSGALDHRDGEGVTTSFVLGTLLGCGQFTANSGEGGLVVGNDGTTRGGGLAAHHAHELAVEVGKALVQGQTTWIAAPFVLRVGAAIGMAQALHGREHIGYWQHGKHIVTTGVDQSAQMLLFHDMADNSERKIVQGSGNGQMTTGGKCSTLGTIGMDVRLPGCMLVKAFLHLGVEAVAVADGVGIIGSVIAS